MQAASAQPQPQAQEARRRQAQRFQELVPQHLAGMGGTQALAAVHLLQAHATGIEVRHIWKPMHRQPVYTDSPAYVNGVSEGLFKTGLCLPSGPLVTDDDVDFIIDAIREAVDKG